MFLPFLKQCIINLYLILKLSDEVKEGMSLFDKVILGDLEVKNAFVRSATYEGLATEKGYLTPELLKIYEDLAKNDVGLIITSYAFITEGEQPSPKMMGIYNDSFIDEYKELTKMVHNYDGKIMLQAVYGGSQSKYKTEDRVILGPSAVPQLSTGTIPKEMTKEDIDMVINAYKDAAERCKEAGFDGIQIHCAHGYLYSQFLDPYHNKRTDEYGGYIENRGRIIFKTFKKIRKAVGDNFHIGVKINCSDFREDGLKFEDCLWVCRELDRQGINSIEISGGDFRTRKDKMYFLEEGKKIAKEVSASVILVGGLRNVDEIQSVQDQTEISAFSLCRPLIMEPDLINKWKNGEIKTAKCVSCHQCLKDGVLKCVFN